MLVIRCGCLPKCFPITLFFRSSPSVRFGARVSPKSNNGVSRFLTVRVCNMVLVRWICGLATLYCKRSKAPPLLFQYLSHHFALLCHNSQEINSACQFRNIYQNTLFVHSCIRAFALSAVNIKNLHSHNL